MPSHVTSLETSKRLKEMGITRSSEFLYYEGTSRVKHIDTIQVLGNADLPAYVLTELLEMLPKELTKSGIDYRLDMFYGNNKCYFGYYDYEQVCYPISSLGGGYLFVSHVHNIETAALLLIKLIENNIVKVENLK